MPHDLSQAYHRSSSFDIRSTLCEAEHILSFLNRMMTGHKKWVVYEHSKSETLAFSRRKLSTTTKMGPLYDLHCFGRISKESFTLIF